MNTVFILDTYNPHSCKQIQDAVRYKFSINGVQYAIYESALEWGLITLPRAIDEETLPDFCYFSTFDEALNFVKEMKRVNEGI